MKRNWRKRGLEEEKKRICEKRKTGEKEEEKRRKHAKGREGKRENN